MKQATPFSEIITETGTVFVEGNLGKGTIAFLADMPAKVIRYRDGRVAVYWHVGDSTYKLLDPFPEVPARQIDAGGQ